MKKNYLLLFFIFISCFKINAYSISKDYDTYDWDYQILATNESCYYLYEDGEKEYYHTLLIRDSKNKINYKIICASEADTLKLYHDYINKYKNATQIKEQLIPELETKVTSYAASDSGTWIFCSTADYVNEVYKNIPDDIFKDLFYEKYESGLFNKEELFECAVDLFDDEGELFQYFFDTDEELNTEEDIMNYLINIILDTLKTDENTEDIENVKEKFRILIENYTAKNN